MEHVMPRHDTVFVDSNIWCYFFNQSAKEHKKVAKYLDVALETKEIMMNAIIVMEVSHFLIKNLGSVRGKEKLGQLLAFPFIVIDFDYNLLLDSVEMLSQYTHTGIGGRDATILATMKKLGVGKLITHDKAFKKIDFIEIMDPIQ